MLASELRMKTQDAILRQGIQRESELVMECEKEYGRLLKYMVKLADEGKYNCVYESNETVAEYCGRRLHNLGYKVRMETIPISGDGRYAIHKLYISW